jgi:uncharacterized protein (TIGR00288 family)
MSMPFTRAPHQGAVGTAPGSGVHAALLIDFDNVTMGMRSDLSKDLKKLLQSDIIKGKVTVQRAYADWRRYPQYIVPLSEASIDLIFAPAYGSSKKNATDIRMAIDGIELVFTRPEIGTFILLTGDSDFSSLVLKLKEYGKYVIGVGIQESSSDILVQNCDEYYSYTSLTGLRKSSDEARTKMDPWELVSQAVNRMAERDDVMRSDRLKQVMIEIDPGFDEGDFGYSKFSRFISEAASKGLLQLTKLENGQFEVGPTGSRADGRRRPEAREPRRGQEGRERDSSREREPRERETREPRERESRGRGGRPRRGEEAETRPATPPASADAGAAPSAPRPATGDESGAGPLRAAYDLLVRALTVLKEQGREAVRDSDVKRRMLELDPAFDETTLGFGKFTRFLRQAHDHEVVNLNKQEGGNYEVSLGGGMQRAEKVEEGAVAEGAREAAAPSPRETERDPRPSGAGTPSARVPAGRDSGSPAVGTATEAAAASRAESPAQDAPAAGTASGTEAIGRGSRGMGPRRGSTRRRHETGPPALLEGQAAVTQESLKLSEPDEAPASRAPETRPAASRVPTPGTRTEAVGRRVPAPEGRGSRGVATELGLPTEPEAQVRYLLGYKGVGRKTAEALVQSFGSDLFKVLQSEPQRLVDVVPAARAEQILDAWKEDYARRQGSVAVSALAPSGSPSEDISAGPSEDIKETGDGQPASSAGPAASSAGPGRRRTRRGGRRGGGRDRG